MLRELISAITPAKLIRAAIELAALFASGALIISVLF